jgi:cold shock CspA family protein
MIRTCKHWRRDRHFGFIGLNGEPDLFIGGKELGRCGIAVPLRVGQRLEFEIAEAKDGKRQAVNVLREASRIG